MKDFRSTEKYKDLQLVLNEVLGDDNMIENVLDIVKEGWPEDYNGEEFPSDETAERDGARFSTVLQVALAEWLSEYIYRAQGGD